MSTRELVRRLCAALMVLLAVSLASAVAASGDGFLPAVDLPGSTGGGWPRLVSAGPAAALAYWDDYAPQPWDDGPHPRAMAQVVTPAGALPAVTLDTEAYDTAAATDSRGRGTVAWVHSGDDGPQIRLADYDPVTGFGPVQVVADRNGPAAVARNDRGDTLVVYQGQNPQYANLFARFRPAGHVDFEPPVVISGEPSILTGEMGVSLAPDGTAAVAWVDWRDTDRAHERALVSIRDASTGSWSDGQVISDPEQIPAYPQVAVASGGGALAAWQEAPGSPGAFTRGPLRILAATRAPAAAFGPARLVGRSASNQSTTPAVTADDAGEGVLVLSDEPTDGWDGRTLTSYVADLRTGELGAPTTVPEGYSRGFVFAANRRGDAAIARADMCLPCDLFGVSERAPGDHAFATARTPIACPDPWPDDVLGVGVDPAGEAAVLWGADDGGEDGISMRLRVSFQSPLVPDGTCTAADTPPPPVHYAPPGLGLPGPPPTPTWPSPTPTPTPVEPTVAVLSPAHDDLAIPVACPTRCAVAASVTVAGGGVRAGTVRVSRRVRSRRRRAVLHVRLRHRDGARAARRLRRRAPVTVRVRVSVRAGRATSTSTRVLRVRSVAQIRLTPSDVTRPSAAR